MAITTEFIEGRTLAEELARNTSKAKKFCAEAGKIIGKLHANNIVHGDLTTSNILLHNKSLVFLDFGLGSISSKIEDFAVDLLAFKKTFAATHYKIIGEWKNVERAYCAEFAQGKAVLGHLKEVEARVRYY